MEEKDIHKQQLPKNRKHSKERNTAFISVIFLLLMTILFLLNHQFDSYKLKTNLTAFQKREMKSTVENFIQVIDSMRKDMKETLDNGHIEYTEEEIKEATLTFVRDVVHESTFANGAYIWINEILNFEGGENYGIRQVHGNLPETEGMMLSTSMEDAKGNLPYLEELNGIKENGELTYNYFFQEYQSDNVSEKITYAKLYEPYNWVVCTGTYLNSLYDPAGGVSDTSKILFYSVYTFFFIMAIALFVYIIVSNDRSSKKLLKETELLKNEVETDSLTGAGSRAFGDSLLQGYMNTFIKNDINCTIALLDIDNFKSVNDCYGHNVGDAVLKNLVETIKMLLHENDNIIRWGGDEFIITINDIDDKLESVLEHINKKIAEQVILSENGEKLHYTISIGASHFSIRDKNITDTIKRVDDALYLAKRTKNSYYIIG